jgi:hypothetical protein
LPGDQIGERGRLAAIRHVGELDAGHHLEQLSGHVTGRTDATRGEVELARVGLGERDQFGSIFRR